MRHPSFQKTVFGVVIVMTHGRGPHKLFAIPAPLQPILRADNPTYRLVFTHMPHRSSFLGLPYRILRMNPKKELLWGLGAGLSAEHASI